MKIALLAIVALLAVSQMATAAASSRDHVSDNEGRALTSPRVVVVKIVKVRTDERSIIQTATVVLPENGKALPMQSWTEQGGKVTDGFNIVLTPTTEDEIDVAVVVMDRSTTTNRRAKRFKLPAGATDQLSMGNGFEVVLHRFPSEQGAGNGGA